MEPTALATDRYELTMVQAALLSGVAFRRATFEVFTRRLPPGRNYGVVAGTARVLEAIEHFRFGLAEVSALEHLHGAPMHLSDTMRNWLLGYRFRGDITGYHEGELFGPMSPILTVSGTFADAVVLETVILSILNHDCAVAAAAAGIVQAAGGAALIEMGSRRTDPDAAVGAARAAMIGGFSATSNLEAGRRYHLATAGTAAHSFTLAHSSEADAFTAQFASQGPHTTLLVDTYDIEAGIRTAVAVAQAYGVPGPGAVRIDSGDLALEAKRARILLDELGASATRIVLSGDLDRQAIVDLVAAQSPVDVFGVGTSVVTGDGHPTAGLSYKLVEIDDADGLARSVAKRSVGKASLGGAKRAVRHEGIDVIVAMRDQVPKGRPLQVSYVADGVELMRPTVSQAAQRLRDSIAELGSRSLTTMVGLRHVNG